MNNKNVFYKINSENLQGESFGTRHSLVRGELLLKDLNILFVEVRREIETNKSCKGNYTYG